MSDNNEKRKTERFNEIQDSIVNRKQQKESESHNTFLLSEGVNKKYTTNVKMHGSQGHGFAAEEANTTLDKLRLKNALIVGNDFKANGPDRFVNGKLIQTKYCKTPLACVNSCFKDGEFRYIDLETGKPHVLEVPKGMGEKSWEIYKKKMGWANRTDLIPSDYVIEGSICYDAAKAIAKPSNVKGFFLSTGNDALYGLVEPSFLLNTGITSVLSFLQNIWKGNSIKDSFASSISIALKNTSASALASVFAGQFARNGGAKVINEIKELIGNIAKVGTKKVASKIAETTLKNVNVGSVFIEAFTTSALITVHLIGDVSKLLRRHISVSQFIKNTAKTMLVTPAGAAGGIAGTIGGGYIGGPVAAMAGREVGSVVGETVIGNTTNLILDAIIEDDELKMLRIIEEEYCRIAENNLLTDEESEQVVSVVGKKITPGLLRQMFLSKNKEQYANSLIMPYVDSIIKKRKRVQVPSESQMTTMFEEIVSDALEAIENEGVWGANPKIAFRNEFGENCCPYCGAPIGGLGYAICRYCDSMVEIAG